MSFGLSASISVHGISQLGLRSYPTGSSVRETTTTIFSFKDDIQGRLYPGVRHPYWGPPGYDCYGQHYGSVLYQQTGRDLFPFSVTPNSGATIPVASYPGHSFQGQAHWGCPQYLGRPPIPAKSNIIDRVGSPFQDRNTDI